MSGLSFPSGAFAADIAPLFRLKWSCLLLFITHFRACVAGRLTKEAIQTVLDYVVKCGAFPPPSVDVCPVIFMNYMDFTCIVVWYAHAFPWSCGVVVIMVRS